MGGLLLRARGWGRWWNYVRVSVGGVAGRIRLLSMCCLHVRSELVRGARQGQMTGLSVVGVPPSVR